MVQRSGVKQLLAISRVIAAQLPATPAGWRSLPASCVGAGACWTAADAA